MKELAGVIPAHLMREQAQGPQAKNKMGKEEFMKLLMTQLRHQDPLKPMDHGEFVAQLAQFSSLEQLSNIKTGIDGVHDGLGEGAKLQALGMIGKRVEAIGDGFALTKGKSVKIAHALGEQARPLKARFYDATGKLAREMDLSALRPGTKALEWDGKDTNGDLLPSGKYSFTVYGVDKDGKPVQAGADIIGQVTGVELQGSDPVLVVETPSGSEQVRLGQVRKVSLEKPENSNGKKPINSTTQTDPLTLKGSSPPSAAKEGNLSGTLWADRRGWRAVPSVNPMEKTR